MQQCLSLWDTSPKYFVVFAQCVLQMHSMIEAKEEDDHGRQKHGIFGVDGSSALDPRVLSSNPARPLN